MNEKTVGNCFSSLNANGNLDPTSMIAFNVPTTEMAAPSAITKAPLLPMNNRAASAKGLSDVASEGRVPMQTICTNMYMQAMIKAASNNANGKLLEGFFTSPLFTSTDSNPPNAKTSKSTVEENGAKAGTFFISK